MRQVSIAAIALSGFVVTPSQGAAPGASGPAIKLSCSGPGLAVARKIAIREKLAVALEPQACLAQTSMYGGGSKQIVASAPSTACGRQRAIQIYERATSGTWGKIIENPVCGTTVSYGPNNPWGGIMITIDGKHFDQRGAYYTPAKY